MTNYHHIQITNKVVSIIKITHYPIPIIYILNMNNIIPQSNNTNGSPQSQPSGTILK
jgi:hypothetical protein